MGQTLSATLAYPPVEVPATDRVQATISIAITKAEGRDLLKESRKSTSPRVPAMPHLSMATGTRNQNSEARTQLEERRIPNDGLEDEHKALKKLFDDLKRPVKRLGDSVSKLHTDLFENNLMLKIYLHDAQANALQVLLRHSITREGAAEPSRNTGKDSMAESILALRESLQCLGQSSEYETRDKELFRAVVEMTYILDSDWNRLQRMEENFKNTKEHSRRCQKKNRQMITCLEEMKERTKFIRQKCIPIHFIREYIQEFEETHKLFEKSLCDIRGAMLFVKPFIEEIGRS